MLLFRPATNFRLQVKNKNGLCEIDIGRVIGFE